MRGVTLQSACGEGLMGKSPIWRRGRVARTDHIGVRTETAPGRRHRFARSLRAFAAATVGVALIGATPGRAVETQPVVVHGAGSTFVNPILSKWAADYIASQRQNGGPKLIYDAVGSGAGLDRIRARTVDFAASDKPLSPAELARLGLGQFPLVIGGVVPVVNIAGVAPGKIRFTGPVLADIYLGKIKRWNDPAIARLNPGLPLPNQTIVVTHRSEGSGTTFNWVDYFCKVSPAWKARVGDGTSVAWPIGVGAKGNDGVSALVRRTPGAIGYVELAYVMRDHLAWAFVQNRAGRFIAPSSASFAAAAIVANWDAAPDFYLVLTDAPGDGAYPITATTFILAPKHPGRAAFARQAALRQLFEWSMFQGQRQAAALGYVPLPQPLAMRVVRYWLKEFDQ
jgi:phosphate transport system substrate-binding protein